MALFAVLDDGNRIPVTCTPTYAPVASFRAVSGYLVRPGNHVQPQNICRTTQKEALESIGRLLKARIIEE